MGEPCGCGNSLVTGNRVLLRGGKSLVEVKDGKSRTVVNAAGAWGDELARRAGVRRLRLRPLRRTAALVEAPAEFADTPMVMDVEGRWYALPESGGLLISASDEISVTFS